MEYDIKITKCGTKQYFKKGTKIYHREDGPAAEMKSGIKYWMIDGKYHREDGPAIECKNWNQWWVHGFRLSTEKEEVLNRWWNNKNGI